MKKISTLMLAAFMVITASAATARPPKVVLNSSANFDVRIDGRMYKGDEYSLRNLSYGLHTVQVYKVSGGFFKRKTLVSTDQFALRSSDVIIDINQWGRTKITEDRFGGKAGWDNGRGNNAYGNGVGQQFPRHQ